jgi:NAD(P)-dependent dehydrogenase (short-subunit alcohol dehydrogenase family)
MGRLDGKVSIITAAGSGMGEAAAKLFAKEGAKVVVADIAPAKGQRVTKEIRDAGGDAIFIEVDVSKASDMERMVKTTVQTYGKLNILYNHAGMPGPKGIEDVTEEEWEQCNKVNMLGGFFASKFAIPEMRKAGGGSILFTASTAGIIGSRYSPTYSAAKGSIVLLTKSLALALARDNIRVNCICPTLANTPMGPDFVRAEPDEDWATTEVGIKRFITTIPLGRMVEPQEVAYAALFLASDEASFITGIFLPVDGGATAM